MIKAFLQRSESKILYTGILIIQSAGFLNLVFRSYYDESVQFPFGLLAVFIYLFTYLQYSALKKFLVSNVLWTVGYLMVFNSNYMLSGALLMGISVWTYQKEKLNP